MAVYKGEVHAKKLTLAQQKKVWEAIARVRKLADEDAKKFGELDPVAMIRRVRAE